MTRERETTEMWKQLKWEKDEKLNDSEIKTTMGKTTHK